MSTQPVHPKPPQGLPPLRTIGDIRAALRHGHGFPGDGAHGILSDREMFEQDLAAALDKSSETDLSAVIAVVRDYRGRIRTLADPGFEAALHEGAELMEQLKEQHR